MKLTPHGRVLGTVDQSILDKIWELYSVHKVRATDLRKRFGLSAGRIRQYIRQRCLENGVEPRGQNGSSEFGSAEIRGNKNLPKGQSWHTPRRHSAVTDAGSTTDS